MVTAVGQDNISDTALHLPFMACLQKSHGKKMWYN